MMSFSSKLTLQVQQPEKCTCCRRPLLSVERSSGHKGNAYHRRQGNGINWRSEKSQKDRVGGVRLGRDRVPENVTTVKKCCGGKSRIRVKDDVTEVRRTLDN